MSNIRMIRNMLLNLLERRNIRKRLDMRYPDEILNDISDYRRKYDTEGLYDPSERDLEQYDLKTLLTDKYLDPNEVKQANTKTKDMFPKDYQTDFERALEEAKSRNRVQEFLDPEHYYPEDFYNE